ncbi:MAG: transcriptional regulator, partial [Flavobacteriaceae bacterium]|nr:transcriptional regulator [Flavobacteriaceae bacterium]
MIGVITGDIIKSQKFTDSSIWLDPLKDAFREIGLTSSQWNIYRGDSFQLVDVKFTKILRHALYLKACVKTVPELDVRMGIG